MKPALPWLMLPVALGAGYIVGQKGGSSSGPGSSSEVRNTKSDRAPVRSPRNDPFGGQSFSLSSMEELRDLFTRQSYSVASARITLAANSLKAEDIPALAEMVQQDLRDKPEQFDRAGYALMNALFERWAEVDPKASVEFVKSSKSRSFQKMAAGSCFSALALVDPDMAVDEFQKLPKGEIRERATMSLISRLSEDEPERACNLLENEASPGGFSSYYAGQIFSKWAKTDPVAAAARLESLPKDRVGDYSAGFLAASWAQKDPAAALKWAKTLTGDRKSVSTSEIYKVIAREDPSKAWEQLKGEPGHLRGKVVGSILEIVADEDPKKAMSMLMTIGSKSEQRIATGSFLDTLNWNDSRIAFDIIEQVKDPATRRDKLGDQMYYAAWTAPDVLKEQIGKLTDREKIDTSGAVLRGLVSSDPKAAEKYFLALPEAQRSTDTLSEMLSQYSNTDPEKAFEFATSLSNPQEQTAAITGLFQNWGREDPEAAAVGWEKLPAGQGRLEALDNIASSWGRSDPEAAKAWADSLSGTEKARALAAVLPALARDNPATASTQLGALIASPPDGMGQNLASSAGNLAGQWAEDDPASASKWAAALPNGNSRDEGLKAVSRAWSRYDAVATANWLGTLEAGSSRDAAIQPLVNQVRDTDPDTAFSWAVSISDENQRLNELRQTLKSWRGSDLNAAREAFDNADLTDKERESLAKELE